MQYVFVLSKENLEIAKEEVISLLNTNKYNSIKNLLIIDIKKNNKIINDLSKRIAYTNSIYNLLFQSNYKDFLKNMENFEWNSIGMGRNGKLYY